MLLETGEEEALSTDEKLRQEAPTPEESMRNRVRGC